MSTEANKALVHRFIQEFWSSGNLSIADELIAPDAIISYNQQEVTGINALKALAHSRREAFPDWDSTPQHEELVAEGDWVVERWTGRGTHQGEHRGIPATGRQVAMPGTTFYRIARGKIVEIRTQFDRMAELEHLGVMPPDLAK
jgi:steroid delta-isomerase-like uncharacterized protein